MYRAAMLSFLACCLFWSVTNSFAQDQKTQLLFVQSAGSMSYSDGVLTLKDVAPLTVFFSDRPQRVAGHMPTKSFMQHWTTGKNSFEKDPPNATLSVFHQNAPATDAVVELTSPKVEGGDISFRIKVLSGKVPAQGGEASLFIDGSDGACWAGYDDFGGDLPCWARKAFSDDRT